ncbi:CD9 antigen [Echinococcus granulosus]|uniref:Tetraspanin n=1 Tax=Echinococcus granulosus TaxID=6210 RepID=U6J0I8_ECHGR|nr:CD9 antigen [Echinococcus granulosus]EUB63766.1 CD9 antigen [Echinococcus granulosus]KAH9286433.1 CD9 antigen [Echinococcus granulosus]CDS15929.1 tetraspanin [Echinococcus granulosus]
MGRACAECLRMVLVIYNFILVLIGLVILGFAVYAYIEPVAQELIEVSNRRTTATVVLFVLMGLGSLTLIVALFGCCGAYHESPCLLATYFIFLIIIFAVQLSGAAAGYFYKEKIFENTERRMREGVFEHMKPIPTLNRQPVLMNAVQKMFECCGVQGPSDYDGKIPMSCCIASRSSCNTAEFREDEIYTHGCLDKYKEAGVSFLQILFLVVFAISFFEIFGLLFSIIMCCIVRKYTADYYEVDYAPAS